MVGVTERGQRCAATARFLALHEGTGMAVSRYSYRRRENSC